MNYGNCRADGCEANARGPLGLCRRCYGRQHAERRRRARGVPVRQPRIHGECSVQGCTDHVKARGWCSFHYDNWLRDGNPTSRERSRRPVPYVAGCEKCELAEKLCMAHRQKRYNVLRKGVSLRERVGRCANFSVCGVLVSPTGRSGLCARCRQRVRNGVPLDRPYRVRTFDGEAGDWYTTTTGYVARSQGKGKPPQLQHRFVMEQMLGRSLRPGENVHHINGVRDDNRPENLELWSTSQPPGQRVDDKIAWAIDFLAEYGYSVSTPPALRAVV